MMANITYKSADGKEAIALCIAKVLCSTCLELLYNGPLVWIDDLIARRVVVLGITFSAIWCSNNMSET